MQRMALFLELATGLKIARSGLSFREWWCVLAYLPTKDARVVVLKILHEMTNQQVGERMDLSHGCVNARWIRSRATLRSMNEAINLLMP